jgi:hypothetical protein
MITSYIHPLSHPLLTCLQHDRMRSGKISSSKGGPLGDREAPWETGRLPIYANVHASRQQSQSGQIIIRKTWTANVHIDADTYRNRNRYCYANAKVQPIEDFFFFLTAKFWYSSISFIFLNIDQEGIGDQDRALPKVRGDLGSSATALSISRALSSSSVVGIPSDILV